MRLVMSVVIATLVLVAPIRQVRAQEATPSAESATPIAIAGSDCTVTPRTAGAIAEIVSATNGVGATPIADPAPYVKPEGTPADQATIDGVTETARQLVACVNAGDYLRFLALFSNDALRRYAEDLDLPLEVDDALLTPTPSEDEQVALGAIADVLLLTDLRVSALISIPEQDAGGDDLTVHLIFVQQSDRWLIDEFILVAPEQSTSWTVVSGTGYQGVIVSAADAADFTSALTGGDTADVWQPTADDVANLEVLLPDFLRAAPNAAPDLWERVSTYLRQYVGIVDSDGQRTILVNAFCNATGSDWQSEPVFVLDGGDCYFTVTYNAETGAFSGLMINGDA